MGLVSMCKQQPETVGLVRGKARASECLEGQDAFQRFTWQAQTQALPQPMPVLALRHLI